MSKNKVQITKEFSCEHRMLTVDSLVRNQVSYDFNPPYQRNKVWTIEAKRCLIETIISNNTINAMHICIKDEDVESYYVYRDWETRSKAESMLYRVLSQAGRSAIKQQAPDVAKYTDRFRFILKDLPQGLSAAQKASWLLLKLTGAKTLMGL